MLKLKKGGLSMTKKEVYFTTSQVAKELECSQKTARKLFREGKIKAKKLGKRWITTKDELKKAITD
jgi:excisionase family DNA binding protein